MSIANTVHIMEIVKEIGNEKVFTEEQVPSKLLGAELSAADREALMAGRSTGLIENMETGDGPRNGKARLRKAKDGSVKVDFTFQREKLEVPEHLYGRALSKEEKEGLVNGRTVPLKDEKGENIYVKIDSDLNTVTVSRDYAMLMGDIPAEIGGYRLSLDDMNTLDSGGQMGTRVFFGKDSYFTAKVALSADRKGLVLSECEMLGKNRDIDALKEKYNGLAKPASELENVAEAVKGAERPALKDMEAGKVSLEDIPGAALYCGKFLKAGSPAEGTYLGKAEDAPAFMAEYPGKFKNDFIDNDIRAFVMLSVCEAATEEKSFDGFVSKLENAGIDLKLVSIGEPFNDTVFEAGVAGTAFSIIGARDLPFDRETGISAGGNYLPEVLKDNLDKVYAEVDGSEGLRAEEFRAKFLNPEALSARVQEWGRFQEAAEKFAADEEPPMEVYYSDDYEPDIADKNDPNYPHYKEADPKENNKGAELTGAEHLAAKEDSWLAQAAKDGDVSQVQEAKANAEEKIVSAEVTGEAKNTGLKNWDDFRNGDHWAFSFNKKDGNGLDKKIDAYMLDKNMGTPKVSPDAVSELKADPDKAKEFFRAHAEGALDKAQTIEEYAGKLSEKGISLVLYESEGKVSGLQFRVSDGSEKGYKAEPCNEVDKKFSFENMPNTFRRDGAKYGYGIDPDMKKAVDSMDSGKIKELVAEGALPDLAKEYITHHKSLGNAEKMAALKSLGVKNPPEEMQKQQAKALQAGKEGFENMQKSKDQNKQGMPKNNISKGAHTAEKLGNTMWNGM